MQKDKKELETQKMKMIDELKQIKKEDLFRPKAKNKISILSKILKIIGYGKKR